MRSALQRKQLISRAAKIRSSFKADKRGRSRKVFDSTLKGARLGSDERRLMSGYSGVDAGGPPRRIEVHRIAMPENACAVRLCKWLIGPRVPEDWFKDLENESEDVLPISAIKPWLISDLTDPPCKPSRAPGYVQVAIAGIMMVG